MQEYKKDINGKIVLAGDKVRILTKLIDHLVDEGEVHSVYKSKEGKLLIQPGVSVMELPSQSFEVIANKGE